MKPRIFSIVIVLFNFLISNAQTKKEIGVIGGFAMQQTIFPQHKFFTKNVTVSKFLGMNYRTTNKKGWFMQFGFCTFNYYSSGSTVFTGFIKENLGNVASMPIDIGKQIQVSKNISFSINLGVAPTWQLYNSYIADKPFTPDLNDPNFSMFYRKQSYLKHEPTWYILAKMGCYFQANLTKEIQVNVGADFWKGFNDMYSSNYHWIDRSDLPPYNWSTQSVVNNGSQYTFCAGLRYKLN